jgi:hypothetical protein
MQPERREGQTDRRNPKDPFKWDYLADKERRKSNVVDRRFKYGKPPS